MKDKLLKSIAWLLQQGIVFTTDRRSCVWTSPPITSSPRVPSPGRCSCGRARPRPASPPAGAGTAALAATCHVVTIYNHYRLSTHYLHTIYILSTGCPPGRARIRCRGCTRRCCIGCCSPSSGPGAGRWRCWGQAPGQTRRSGQQSRLVFYFIFPMAATPLSYDEPWWGRWRLWGEGCRPWRSPAQCRPVNTFTKKPKI